MANPQSTPINRIVTLVAVVAMATSIVVVSDVDSSAAPIREPAGGSHAGARLELLAPDPEGYTVAGPQTITVDLPDDMHTGSVTAEVSFVDSNLAGFVRPLTIQNNSKLGKFAQAEFDLKAGVQEIRVTALIEGAIETVETHVTGLEVNPEPAKIRSRKSETFDYKIRDDGGVEVVADLSVIVEETVTHIEPPLPYWGYGYQAYSLPVAGSTLELLHNGETLAKYPIDSAGNIERALLQSVIRGDVSGGGLAIQPAAMVSINGLEVAVKSGFEDAPSAFNDADELRLAFGDNTVVPEALTCASFSHGCGGTYPTSNPWPFSLTNQEARALGEARQGALDEATAWQTSVSPLMPMEEVQANAELLDFGVLIPLQLDVTTETWTPVQGSGSGAGLATNHNAIDPESFHSACEVIVCRANTSNSTSYCVTEDGQLVVRQDEDETTAGQEPNCVQHVEMSLAATNNDYNGNDQPRGGVHFMGVMKATRGFNDWTYDEIGLGHNMSRSYATEGQHVSWSYNVTGKGYTHWYDGTYYTDCTTSKSPPGTTAASGDIKLDLGVGIHLTNRKMRQSPGWDTRTIRSCTDWWAYPSQPRELSFVFIAFKARTNDEVHDEPADAQVVFGHSRRKWQYSFGCSAGIGATCGFSASPGPETAWEAMGLAHFQH